jgi:hypothetical protein
MQAVAELNGLTNETVATLPVCPHCGDDPAKLSVMPQQFPGGMVGTIIFCGNNSCRKIISTQILGMQQQNGPVTA